jgi:hypothetical protein
MFTLSLIEHSLPMPPHLLKRPLLDSIKAELDRLFLDKVIPGSFRYRQVPVENFSAVASPLVNGTLPPRTASNAWTERFSAALVS